MASINRVIVMGNLTRDPELRYTPGGAAVTSFGLGVNRRFRDRDGLPNDEVTFLEIVAWGKQAETCSEYLGKGRLVLIEGRLRQERWKTPEGEARSALKVVAERVQFLSNGRPQAAEEDAEADGASTPESEVPF
jgi:single-strand DNA-binding protein